MDFGVFWRDLRDSDHNITDAISNLTTLIPHNITTTTTVAPDILPAWRNSAHFPPNTQLPRLDQELLENRMAFFSFYGVLLPIMTILGCLGNIVTFFVFHHPEMRCLSTMFISAILVSDTFFLIGVTVVMSPRAWVAHVHYYPDNPTFWTILDHSEKLFLGMYPITEMAQCLVVWYTVALAIEQYFVFYHPVKLWKYSTRDKGLQVSFISLYIYIELELVYLSAVS